MSSQSRSWMAILGLLTYGPMTGYELRQLIENSLRFFWNESYGQIYPTLKALAEEGLATMRVEPQEDRPDRKVYTITEKGHQELKKQLAKPIRAPIIRNEMLLRLFFGSQMDPASLRSMLEQFIQTQEGAYKAYNAAEQALKEEGHPDEIFWMYTLNYGKHHARAVTQWAKETLDALQGLPDVESE